MSSKLNLTECHLFCWDVKTWTEKNVKYHEDHAMQKDQ